MIPLPSWDDDGVPWCDCRSCPAHDGKRCRLLGFKAPDGEVCPPAVKRMAAERDELRRKLEAL